MFKGRPAHCAAPITAMNSSLDTTMTCQAAHWFTSPALCTGTAHRLKMTFSVGAACNTTGHSTGKVQIKHLVPNLQAVLQAACNTSRQCTGKAPYKPGNNSHAVPSFHAVWATRQSTGSVQCRPTNLSLVAAARASLTSLLGEGLATAAAPVKGGFIREALTSHYPRLAALLEETFRRILQDTNVGCDLNKLLSA